MFYHLLFFVPSVLLSRQVNKIDFVGIKKDVENLPVVHST